MDLNVYKMFWDFSYAYTYIYIYIYIEREREREREKERERFSVMDKEEISLATKRYTNHTTWTKSAVY